MIICGDCRDVVPDATGLDVMITDPPYSAAVHKNATSHVSRKGSPIKVVSRDLGFTCLDDDLRVIIGRYATQVSRWSVIYSDLESTHLLRAATSAKAIRTLTWIRWSMPQLSGDRPPQGREDLAIFHADTAEDLALFYGAQRGRKAWNGPGNLTHLSHLCLRGANRHKTEKPLDQALDLVTWFSDPGETVFDPFAGSGTFGLACKILGREYVGIEKDPEWAAKAEARIEASSLSDRDQTRYSRWIESGSGAGRRSDTSSAADSELA